MSVLVLLGPQRFNPTLRDTIRSLGIEGPLAVVTAGWKEREAEDEELRAHVDREVIDLLLYRRAEEVLQEDPELAAALRKRQRVLKHDQDLYRMRLSHALQAARELMHGDKKDRLLEAHRREAIQSIRTLDRQHLRRLREIHQEFDAVWHTMERPSLERHRFELASIIKRVGAVALAGGHVAVLLNRLRLFDMGSLLAGSSLIAWSAGAMAISDRIVLFHDSPPQGAGDPEVLDAGLSLCSGVLPLPHARRRLRLDDPVRVSLFARRFSQLTCVLFDEGARMDYDRGSWRAGPGTRQMSRSGRLREIGRS